MATRMGSVPVTEHAPSVVSLRRKEIALLLDALGASRVASGASGMSARCAQIRQLEQRPIADATPRKDTANNNHNRVSACGRTGYLLSFFTYIFACVRVR